LIEILLNTFFVSKVLKAFILIKKGAINSAFCDSAGLTHKVVSCTKSAYFIGHFKMVTNLVIIFFDVECVILKNYWERKDTK